jgi:penicillin-binding protein 2
MERDADRVRSFTRRAVLVGIIQGGCMGALVGRLAWLQIAQGQKYRMLAENNRINIKLLPPTRGLILDRYGRKMAMNDQDFSVVVVPEQAGNLDAVLARLRPYVTLDDSDIRHVLKDAKKQASYLPLEIKSSLNWDEVSAIEVHLPDLPGIAISEGQVRNYPYAESAAHVTGYVGSVTEADLTGDPLLSLPNFRIGRTGVEKSFGKALRGKAGTAEVEVNVVGREVRELNRYDPTPGDNVWLTLDSELQTYCYERLRQERSASAVVMDVKTGAIYALASYPAYDPNVFSRGIPTDLWERLSNDPGHPLVNKAISGLYPPGSCFKVATALALLETGHITRDSTQFCPGYFDLGNNRFHCWKHSGHGWLNVVQAIKQSCDVFFYKNSLDLGIDALSSYAMKLGLGQKTGIDLDEDKAGLVPTRQWKYGRFGEAWQKGETVITAIGQGYTTTTPLQLAMMAARIASGHAVKPSIAGYVGKDRKEHDEWPSLGFKKANLDIVHEGMDMAVNTLHGTAYAARIKDPLLAMAGKTGSAQVKRITRAERAANIGVEDLPWNLRDHALFISFAPVGNPRYACAVVVEHGMHGGSAAAPIARDLLMAVQKRDPGAHIIMPADKTQAPERQRPNPTGRG